MTFHIAYSCNDKYVEQTMVSMVSVMENHINHKIIFYLIEDGISSAGLQLIESLIAKYNQGLVIKKLDEMIGDNCINGGERHPKTIYAKIFLENVCDSDRILYLDSDTVINASLEDLWNMEMRDCYIAGVKMPYSDQKKKKLGLDVSDTYVCDGVLLINLDSWRKKNLKLECLDYIEANDGKPLMMSEGTVNYISKKHVKNLPPKYNLMSSMIMWNAREISELFDVSDYYSDQDLMEAREKPIIIHYLNELYIRPWFLNSDHPYKKKYLEYRVKAGCQEVLDVTELGKRTKVLKLLNRYMPFCVFKRIYRRIKKGQ